MDNIPTLEQFKKIVKEAFKKEHKANGLKLGHAYNTESRKYGFKNWNTCCAFLKKNDLKNKG